MSDQEKARPRFVIVPPEDAVWTGPDSWIWWPKTEPPESAEPLGDGWTEVGFMDETGIL